MTIVPPCTSHYRQPLCFKVGLKWQHGWRTGADFSLKNYDWVIVVVSNSFVFYQERVNDRGKSLAVYSPP
jgi:hypothetical protein